MGCVPIRKNTTRDLFDPLQSPEEFRKRMFKRYSKRARDFQK